MPAECRTPPLLSTNKSTFRKKTTQGRQARRAQWGMILQRLGDFAPSCPTKPGDGGCLKTGGFRVHVKNTQLTSRPLTRVLTNVYRGFVFQKNSPPWAVQFSLFMP
jgi:hypothetical protein